MRWARIEPLVSLALAVLVALPMLLVHYAPIDDGPEHLLGPWLEAELGRAGSPASALYQPSGSPPTYFVIPMLIRLGLAFVEPATLLRSIAFLLPIGLLAAVRANLAGARPQQKLAAMLIAALLVLDVSYYKGFVSFYFGVIVVFLATACLERARGGAGARRWPLAYGALAVVSLLAHPLAFVLLGMIIGLRILIEQRDPRWLVRVLLWSLPSLLAAFLILGVLVSGSDGAAHALSPNYMFGPFDKARGFFREGWGCLGRWQIWLSAASFALFGVMWLTRDVRGRWTRLRPPPLTLALALLYVVLPEEFAGWSWISIRIPLLVGMCAAWELAASAPPIATRAARIRAAALLVGVALFLVQIGLSTRAVLGLGGAIEDFVAAEAVIPEKSVLLPFLPPTYPSVGRVNVLHHATAYIAMSRAAAYPEVFARDARQHRSILRPELRSEVFGFEPEVEWHVLVSHDHRASWFESHPRTIAVTFEVEPAIAERLGAAAREVVRINDRVTVYFGKASPSR